jgi:hypothetical protein
MCLPLVVFLLASTPWLGAWMAGSLVTAVAACTAALHWASGGWYTYYVLRFPFLQPWVKPVFVTFWTRDLFGHLPIASAAAAVTLAWLLPSRSRGAGFWIVVAVGMVGGAYRSRLQNGGYDNVLLPAYAVVAIVFGLGLAALLRDAQGSDARRQGAHIAIYAGCLAQMIGLGYNPRAALPRAGDRRAGEQLLRTLEGLKGDVFVPYHGYLAALAGKPSHAHVMQVFDVLKVGLPESEALAEEHRAAIREHRFGAIVLDEPETYFFIREVETSYVRDRELFADPDAFFPVTGVRTRPQYLYVPRRPTAGLHPEGAPAGR